MAEARQGLIWRGFLQEWHMAPFLDKSELQLVEANRPAFLNAFLQRSDKIEGVPEHIVEAMVENLTFAGDVSAIDQAIEHLQEFERAGLDEVALMSPATNPTVGCCARTTWAGPGFTVAVIAFVSAVVDAIVPVATPAASVSPGCTNVFAEPVAASMTA